VSKKI